MTKALIRLAIAVLGFSLLLGLDESRAFAAAPFESLSYRAIGPAISGGRATAVAGSDRNPLVYYAGGAGGGVFKSIDGGASWRPVFDRQPVAPIGAIAVNANDVDDVWAGTGEANPRNEVEQGNGIYHSRDGGKTWVHLGLDDAGSISKIEIDPRDPRTVVVGVLGQIFRDNTTRGVYITHDAGAHWTRTLYVGPSSGVSDVVRVPDRPATLFAGVWQFRRQPWTMSSGGPNGGIYRSDDGGTSWRKLQDSGLPDAPTGRIGLAAATHGRIYAILQSKAGELWRSNDGGAHWTPMPHSPFLGARPFYFSRIFVDRSNPDRLINVSLILSESIDGGKKFRAIAMQAGWDYHQVWWSADGQRIAVGSDEGVVISADAGKTFWQSYDLPLSQPYHVAFDKAKPYYNVCIGLQDDNSWCAPSTSPNGIGVLNRDWYQIAPGDGMWSVFDPKDPAYVWSSSTNTDTGNIYLTNLKTREQFEVSPDAESNGEEAASALRYRFNWDTPVAFTHDGKALVGGNVIFESADRGQTWTAISADLTRNDKAHEAAPGGPINLDESGAENYNTILSIETSKLPDGPIWVGTDDGLVHCSRDDGAHWTNVTPKNLPEGRIPTVEPGHFNAATAYFAMDRHMSGDERPYIFKTDDFGSSWQSISGNLPSDLFVRVIREDLVNRNVLYAGTQRGIFVSFDRGAHWENMRLNMPATAIYDLELEPDYNDLVVAAHGRGVWIFDDVRPFQEWNPATASRVALFQPRDAYRVLQVSPVQVFTNPKLPSNEFIGANKPYGALATYYLPNAVKQPIIQIADANGRVIRHMNGKDVPGKAGFNRVAWDLNEDAPAQWKATFEQNRGPSSGPEAVPGVYTIRLIADGTTQATTVTVKSDPNDPTTADAAVARHAFLVQVNNGIDTVDRWLNAIDERVKADPSSVSRYATFRRKLTLEPKNIEDLEGPAGIRERLLDLLSRVASTSYQAPTAAQANEGARLEQQLSSLKNEARALGL